MIPPLVVVPDTNIIIYASMINGIVELCKYHKYDVDDIERSAEVLEFLTKHNIGFKVKKVKCECPHALDNTYNDCAAYAVTDQRMEDFANLWEVFQSEVEFNLDRLHEVDFGTSENNLADVRRMSDDLNNKWNTSTYQDDEQLATFHERDNTGDEIILAQVITLKRLLENRIAGFNTNNFLPKGNILSTINLPQPVVIIVSNDRGFFAPRRRDNKIFNVVTEEIRKRFGIICDTHFYVAPLVRNLPDYQSH